MVSPWSRAGMVLATLTVAGFLLPPATAATFLTKKKADKRYINVGEKATDADLLDGQNSTSFLGANQKAVDAELLDGLNSGAFQGAYQRTIVVSPVGTSTQNGAALLAALDGITGNTGPNATPYLVKIEPGIYNVGSTPLQMKENVDVEGSGADITQIRGDGASSPGTATVLGAFNSELRFVTVLSVGGSYATAVRLTDVTDVLHVRAFAQGGAVANKGFEVASGLSKLSDVFAFVTAPSNSNAYGVFSAGNPYMAEGFIQASGGTSSYAIYVEANEFNIDRSLLIGGTDAVNEAGPDGTVVRVGASRLQGGVSGTVNCAQTYDGNYIAAENNACPS